MLYDRITWFHVYGIIMSEIKIENFISKNLNK